METFSALLAICEGKSPGPGEFPAQRQVTWSFDVFLDLRLNIRLSKQSWGWWFEMLSRPLWRHCDDNTILIHAAEHWIKHCLTLHWSIAIHVDLRAVLQYIIHGWVVISDNILQKYNKHPILHIECGIWGIVRKNKVWSIFNLYHHSAVCKIV